SIDTQPSCGLFTGSTQVCGLALNNVNVIRDIPLVGTAPVAVMVAILVVAAAAALFMGAIRRIVIAAIAAAITTGIVWVV
ncbi:hypothetical protein, partial [Bacteroides thetaiotaomicron]|uniref:hypothetical protein n=1 Tax=Bacteroides thetaiotaomicron TaxID=818 RepID=UPI001A91298B